MNRLAPSAAVLLCAVIAVFPSAARAADPDRVHSLVQQLDDPRFEIRQSADQALRDLGIAVVPLLRKELKARHPLEVHRRIEAIVKALSLLKWRDDLGDGLREARRTGKPLLVLSSLGERDGFASLASLALQKRTLTDLELVDFLNANFVLVWHNHLPEIDAGPDLLLPEWPTRFTDEQIQAYRPGKFAGNVRMFFCTANGRVLHYVEGFQSTRAVRDEARFALTMSRQLQDTPTDRLPEATRQALGGRAFERVTSSPDCRTWGSKAMLGRNRHVIDLAGQEVEPMIQTLRPSGFSY